MNIKPPMDYSNEIEMKDSCKENLLRYTADEYKKMYKFASNGQDVFIYDSNKGYYVECYNYIEQSLKIFFEKKFYTEKFNKKDNQFVIEYFPVFITKNNYKDIINNLSTKTILPDDWNRIPNYSNCFNFKNIILAKNVNNGKWEYLYHSPEYYFNYQFDFDFDKSLTFSDMNTCCPIIDGYISEWVAPKDIDLIWEWIGFHLDDKYSLKKLMVIYGKPHSGKSQFLNLMNKFLGYKNVSSVSIKKLSENEYAAGSLFGKKANMVFETSFDIVDGTMIKNLTGDDKINSSKKYKDDIEFWNTAKLTVVGNNLPIFNEYDEALYSRMLLLEFPNTFEGNNKIINLIDTITEKELSGMFFKALHSYEKLMKNMGFSGDLSIRDTAEKYQKISNPLYEFVDKYCMVDSAFSIEKNRLSEVYTDIYGKKLSSYKFKKHLLSLDKNIYEGKGGDNLYYYRGIDVKQADINKILRNASLKKIMKEVE